MALGHLTATEDLKVWDWVSFRCLVQWKPACFRWAYLFSSGNGKIPPAALCGDGMEGITKSCLIKGDEVCLDNVKRSRKEGRPAPSKRCTLLPAKRKGVDPAWTLLPGLEFRKTHLLLYFFHSYSWFPTGPVTWQSSSRHLRNTCTHTCTFTHSYVFCRIKHATLFYYRETYLSQHQLLSLV